uniref:Uncharacterized protein n=1 Tax=Ananas comosus var. bracteatus TaxID=296719 RepID=A0A6V7Q8V3_ANACO|nr:unnamed protein product [Ananas comosus var. bracteatus]
MWRVSAEPGSERQGDKLCRGLNDKVTGYARIWMTRLARRVSHRLVILGYVCDWTDEDVRTLTRGVLIIIRLKHFGPVFGPNELLLLVDWVDTILAKSGDLEAIICSCDTHQCNSCMLLFLCECNVQVF